MMLTELIRMVTINRFCRYIQNTYIHMYIDDLRSLDMDNLHNISNSKY